MVYGLVDYRNEEKKFEHLDFISNLSFTITVTVFTSISVEISRKIARPLEGEKKKLRHHHVISIARVLISNLASSWTIIALEIAYFIVKFFVECKK